jgi:predicted AlkP superfamily phosphohydrolase/phosphomutase/Tfp pilus assembly protein PilF
MSERGPAWVLLVALLLVGCARADRPHHVVVLGIDGLDPETIDLLSSEGRLPNLARMRETGAYGRLRSEKPLLSPIIWTTIATGKPPTEHGIGHFVAVNQKTGEQLPVTSQMRRARALWNILSDAGRSVAVVGWWATWPAEHVDGTIVSDHTCYHFLFPDGARGSAEDVGLVYPPERLREIAPLVRRPGDVRPDEIAPFVDVGPDELARPFDFEDELAHFKWAWATAESYRRIGLRLWDEDRPDLLMVYIEGVDTTSHLFGHLFRAEGLAGELAAQQARYGRAVEEMYVYADRLVGAYRAAIGPDATLVVLSDHGFRLGVLPDDPSTTRDLRRVSERYHRDEGVLYLSGARVKPHTQLEQPTLLDVTPTLLALEGLPAARDMAGRVLTEALDFDPPPRTVASYEPETQPGGATALESDAPVDPAILERLRSLGYLDAQSPTGERNLAAMRFEEGRFAEAAEAYRRLVADKPEDAALRASLAGALGKLGRFDEALEQIEVAIRLDPLNAQSYHNRAVIHEHRGATKAAVEDYRTALRYRPSYEPSRAALARLTGSPEVDGPKTDAQRLATKLAQRASRTARRGDYAEAMKLLDEAERIAPSYALIPQYRSNVAFLMGDVDAAIAALERGLELEPDNQLFRTNLARLREKRATAEPAPAP